MPGDRSGRLDPGGGHEDFFSLTYRGLKEELGLDPDDCRRLAITWFGWSHPAQCWVVVAVVRSKLGQAAIEERQSQCHSVYEHDGIRWVPLTRNGVTRVVEQAAADRGAGENWSYLAPLVALETWRNRDRV